MTSKTMTPPSMPAGFLRAAALTVATISIGCSGGGDEPEPLVEIDRVVFVTIDTLRADHMGSFGYPIDTTPFIDGLAAQGTSFKKAFAHSATTGPSHSSMFTGLYPIQHLVQNNGRILDEGFVTLAEVLGENGFSTAAFVSGMSHFGVSQIGQGFAHYDEPVAEARNEGGRVKQYRPADMTIDSVVEWLDEPAADDPFFMWVHFYDPHRPMQPPEDLLDKATPDTEEELEAFRSFLRDQHRSRLAERIVNMIHEYDAETMLADREIGRLFGSFEEHGIADNTLWVITSDHGQGLGNHDWFGHHEQVYNVQLHVPLIFYYSGGGLAAGDVDDQIVEQVDIPVTILELLGLDFEDQVAPVQGLSLVPMLLGESGYDHKNYAFAERRRTFRNREREDEPRELGERYALQDLEYKYIWFSEGPDEFYDIADDPYETTDLIDIDHPRKDEMKAIIEGMVARLALDGEAGTVDEETLERLRALGYLR